MAEKPKSKVLQGNSQLALDLYKTLSQGQDNVFFSPISVHAVLSMAYQGAQGTTAKQFAEVLKISEAKTAAEGYKDIMESLNSLNKVTLHMANKIYVMKGRELMKDFEKATKNSFSSEVELVNFHQKETAAKTINSWVEKKTSNKIKKVIEPENLTDETSLVLLNAIYFKGNGEYSFNKCDTRRQRFYLNDVDTDVVEMMSIEKTFKYEENEELDAQILEMPYTNKNVVMVFILPKKRNGIEDLEKKLLTTNLSEIGTNLSYTKVEVMIPKFKFEQSINLKNIVSTLGLNEMFDSVNANFQGMVKFKADDDNLYVGNIIQKSFIEVNEEGTEAVADTGLYVAYGCPSRFWADHPFIFLLMHKTQGRKNPLFVGRISQPSKL